MDRPPSVRSPRARGSAMGEARSAAPTARHARHPTYSTEKRKRLSVWIRLWPFGRMSKRHYKPKRCFVYDCERGNDRSPAMRRTNPSTKVTSSGGDPPSATPSRRAALTPAALGLDPVLARRERLPNELELAEALDVSHVTVRAALRELERDDLLEIRRGRHGGAYITGVPVLGGGASPVGALKQRADALRHALELRRLLEPEAAALAASRAAPRDLVRLRRAHKLVADREEADDSSFMAADTAFHLELARASGNPQIARSIERPRFRPCRSPARGTTARSSSTSRSSAAFWGATGRPRATPWAPTSTARSGRSRSSCRG